MSLSLAQRLSFPVHRLSDYVHLVNLHFGCSVVWKTSVVMMLSCVGTFISGGVHIQKLKAFFLFWEERHLYKQNLFFLGH